MNLYCSSIDFIERTTIDYICKLRQKTLFKLLHKKRSRFLEKKLNDADTSKLKFAAIETLLESKKKQTLSSVFPGEKLESLMIFSVRNSDILGKIPPVAVDLKIPASGDFLETFENVDNLYVVLVSNQMSPKSQPSQNVPSRILKKLSFSITRFLRLSMSLSFMPSPPLPSNTR